MGESPGGGAERSGCSGGRGQPPARRRLFFALELDEACRAGLAEAATGFLAGVPGRALASADWHVTLCFLGAVEESLLASLCAQAALLEASGFVLHFERLAYWREAHVFAALAAPPPAAALQLAEALRTRSRALGLSPDDKPLRPHVTLMRVASRQARLAAAAPRAMPVHCSLQATEFQLFESRDAPAPHAASTTAPGTTAAGTTAAGATAAGPSRYRSLARWPLRP